VHDDSIKKKLLGELPLRRQRDSPPATFDMFLQKPLGTGREDPYLTWYHCRACSAFLKLTKESLRHPDLVHLHLDAQTVQGKYIEVDKCWQCCSGVGLINPRLVPVPVAS
jgi:hypothetical protein